jgi:hypothetical protein
MVLRTGKIDLMKNRPAAIPPRRYEKYSAVPIVTLAGLKSGSLSLPGSRPLADTAKIAI